MSGFKRTLFRIQSGAFGRLMLILLVMLASALMLVARDRGVAW